MKVPENKIVSTNSNTISRFFPSCLIIARHIALYMIIILLWLIAYFTTGKKATPGGQLFNTIILCMVAYVVGKALKLIFLPPLLGCTVIGFIFHNAGLIKITSDYVKMTSILRKISLVILLIRAGLELQYDSLRTVLYPVLLLGISPWLLEAGLMIILSHFFLSLPWLWASLLGCIIPAVAPAIVIPSLTNLRNKGYELDNGISTLIIAVAGIHDVLSFTLFAIFDDLLFSENSTLYLFLITPISFVIGLIGGTVGGWILTYIPDRNDIYSSYLRVFILFFGGTVVILMSDKYGFEGAGPLCILAATFICSHKWNKQNENAEDKIVLTFEILWIFCEPILFSTTGAQIDLKLLNAKSLTIAIAIIVACLMARTIFTMIISSMGSQYTGKEQLFIALSWISKASVQSVLAPTAFEYVKKYNLNSDLHFAETLLTTGVLSVIIMAPIGSILMNRLGPILLQKRAPGKVSHRRNTVKSVEKLPACQTNYETNNEEHQSSAKRKNSVFTVINEI